MITKKTRQGVLLLLVLTGVSFWTNRNQNEDGPAPVTGIDPSLDYVLRDFELQFFDVDGNPTLNLKAPILRNNPELELGTIENPVMIYHEADATWDFSSETATVTADKEHVELSGHVNLYRRELASGQWVELNTSTVSVEVTPRTAMTDEAVSFFDGRNQVDAIGMDLDMINNTIKLKKQVKAIYAVE